MKRLLMMCAAVSLCACTPPAKMLANSASATAEPAPSIAGIPAGDYVTDPAHTSLTFLVDHMGFSHYTARFATVEARLKLDPAHPDQASLNATIDPSSLALNTPPKGFHATLMSKEFFDVPSFPEIRFASTNLEVTGANTAKVTGNLTLHGVSKPVSMAVVFNGGYAGMAGYDPHARIGFSAKGQLKRSDFGMGYGEPPPGSTMGVGDAVDFEIETEMSGPPLKTK